VNIDTLKHLASRALSLGSGSLFLAWASTAARAAEPLGTIATNIHGNLDETLKLATVVVFITGFILVGIGVFLIWRMGRHQGMHAPATLFTCLAAVIAGVLMVYHSTVVGVGGATIFGDSNGDVTIEGTVEVR
jgi:hypothetical protein